MINKILSNFGIISKINKLPVGLTLARMAIVRIRHPKGILKIELLSAETKILWLYEKVSTELASKYPEVNSFWISLDPQEPHKSRLLPSSDSYISLSHGQLLYLHLKNEDILLKKNDSKLLENDLDKKIGRLSGKIMRKRDERLCRHGPSGMCEHCQPLEPYDAKYLESQGVKHLSFYSWLKKLRDSNNSGIPTTSLLEKPNYTVDQNCPYHAPFPAAICTKCQPSAIILRRQPFRMVDHVEIASPGLIDEFLVGWRNSGFQRFGWLIGKYDSYTDQVPLGIKAVVEYIYEPQQDGSVDGFQLLDSNNDSGIDPRHAAIFKAMNLEVIGMIYTDLIDDGMGTGKVKHRRSQDTFFVSGTEVLFISHQQANHPFYLPEDPTFNFSSRFVTVVVSGESNGGIGLKAYQVSESAVAMEEAKLIAATTDPSLMLVRSVDESDEDPDKPLYVPQVFYKFKNEYGIEVQKAADPLFPVEYLLVTLSEGIPLQPSPMFKAPLSFPAPYLHPTSSNLAEYFNDTLHLNPKELASSGIISNANLILFLAQAGLFANEIERMVLCQAISNSSVEIITEFIEKSETWQRVISTVSEAVAISIHNKCTSNTWTCKHCTFVNEKSSSNDDNCDMCGLPQQ